MKIRHLGVSDLNFPQLHEEFSQSSDGILMHTKFFYPIEMSQIHANLSCFSIGAKLEEVLHLEKKFNPPPQAILSVTPFIYVWGLGAAMPTLTECHSKM